ncbi:MAG: biotin transporter BioY [Clostridia bacterium]|nr:biotin transporter BioY [Clostridia bacterium]
MKNYSARLAAADIAECAIFVALMIAGAFIKIPFPFMPLTFQTVFSVLAGLLLGWKKGMISMFAYMLTGLIGLPVFTGGGGIAYVVMPSFGYILGFIAAAGVAGIAYKRRKKIWQIILLSLAAFLVDYVFGIAYFIAVWTISGYSGLGAAIVTYNLVYMPKDAVFAVLAALLSAAVTPQIIKMHRKISNRGEKAEESDAN